MYQVVESGQTGPQDRGREEFLAVGPAMPAIPHRHVVPGEGRDTVLQGVVRKR